METNQIQLQPKKKFSKKKKVIIIIVAFVLLAVIGGLLGTSAPTKAARIFTQGIIDGNFQQMYDNSYSQFKKDNTFEEFSRGTETLSLYESDADISFTSRSIENNQAQISGSVKNKDGKKSYIVVELIKTTEGWKVTGLEWGDLNK